MAQRVWWRYKVVGVGGIMEGRVDVGDKIIDWTDGDPDQDWRDYNIMKGGDPSAGWFSCELIGPYDGPFGDDGRPGSREDGA